MKSRQCCATQVCTHQNNDNAGQSSLPAIFAESLVACHAGIEFTSKKQEGYCDVKFTPGRWRGDGRIRSITRLVTELVTLLTNI